MVAKVINLFGASGVGKSTTAAATFAKFKLEGQHAELVSEYVKGWAWEKRVPGKFDQVYLFGKQARRESLLYDKVDYIVTDSPLWLSAFYEQRYVGREIISPAVHNFLDYSHEHGVVHYNFWLRRTKPYDPRGRFESKEGSEENHKLLREFLDKHAVPLIDIPVADVDRAQFIYDYFMSTVNR
jgi:AAA domain-containing protein